MRVKLRGLGSIYRRKKRTADGRLIELPKWWIKYYRQGRPIREPTGTPQYSLALKKLRARIREIEDGAFAGPKADRLRIGELLDGLLLHYKLNNRSYRDFAKPAVTLHLRPGFGELRARDLDTPRVQSYQLKRQAEGAASGTINRECALLKAALNLARRQTPPKIGFVPHIPRLAENNVRKGFLEYVEFVGLREALPEDIRPILTFAYYTGCRLGEILSLKWTQVDPAHCLVRLEPGETKNAEARHFVMAPDLSSTITTQRAIRDERYPACPWVFFRYATGKQVRDFRGAWAAACIAAGLADEQGEPVRIFHDLRRTGVRNLVRSGVSEAVAMRISGHKTRSVFDRYNITSDRDLVDAAAKLAAYVDGMKQHYLASKQSGTVTQESLGKLTGTLSGTPTDRRKETGYDGECKSLTKERMSKRESGGIGRRARLRIWSRKGWGFESPLSHQKFSVEKNRGTRPRVWHDRGPAFFFPSFA